MTTSIKQWYETAYPTDTDFDISADTTFDDLMKNIRGFDELVAPDSVIRDRVFGKLSERTGLPFKWFIYTYFNNTEFLEQLNRELTLEII